ncbi:hypothetical protein [Absidia glauca]|uniref:Uncharacterized protein n=1 Tax=Absidia glauca TaxID=4829 RepID=A0A163JRN0_ABSGL|nr:hypothetical protein [Absidia glauca]
MVARTIRILTDKSPTAHHHADALAKGVQNSGSLFNVAVGDLARTPSDAFYNETALEDIRLDKSDVLLFSSTLIEILNDYGLEQDAILLQAKSDNDDQELYDLGKRFAEQLE